MPSEIVVALIGLCGSALGSIVGVLASAKLTQYRLQELEKKVDKHNSLVERVYRLEDNEKLTAEKFSVLNHRVGDLERGAAV